jgi:hypothetical protein
MVAILIAVLLPPLIPAPGGTAVTLIAWVAAAVLAVMAVLYLLRNPTD